MLLLLYLLLNETKKKRERCSLEQLPVTRCELARDPPFCLLFPMSSTCPTTRLNLAGATQSFSVVELPCSFRPVTAAFLQPSRLFFLRRLLLFRICLPPIRLFLKFVSCVVIFMYLVLLHNYLHLYLQFLLCNVLFLAFLCSFFYFSPCIPPSFVSSS